MLTGCNEVMVECADNSTRTLRVVLVDQYSDGGGDNLVSKPTLLTEGRAPGNICNNNCHGTKRCGSNHILAV